MSEPDLENLPEWVKSQGLPPEAAAAIDRYWKPVWEQLRLLPEHPRRGDELEVEAVRELEPGPEWQARFETMWPTYRTWYLQEGEAERPDLETCRAALRRHMPELVPVHERLCELFPGCDVVAYGHSHMPEVSRAAGVWIVNPGSPTERRRAPGHTMVVIRDGEPELVALRA